MTHATRFRRPSPRDDRLPLAGLLALATAGFVTIMTEALPAGILPAMSADLGVSESAAGQSVMVYAVGSLLAAVPLTAATATWPRRRLLLTAISGFALANTVTAVSSSYPLTMTARFLAGVVAGLLWALVAGYARRMVPAERRGRATAVAMAGTPVALSIGVPAGTSLAGLVGWRSTFGIMTLLSLALVVWVILAVPSFPGAVRESRLPLRKVPAIPGVAPVLTVTLTFVLAHNLLYTYIAPFLGPVGLADRVDVVLLTFGVASLGSILATGALVDRHLRRLMIAGCSLFAAAALLLGLLGDVPALVYVSAAIWGAGFGGAATVLQTASAEAAGAAGDVAQSLIVTCWNIGIAGGAAAGGVLLGTAGSGSLPWWALVLVAAAFLVTVTSRRHGFPNLARRLARDQALSPAARPDEDVTPV
ncbi:MFS transporter [Nonomuraea pusilla]|uniref:Predicted arabinose efflux permease, MFS family n=1 Tax=Nonomuraea pusilla TaxID=46177 RepID=A0A1H7XI71_9ACTN|nr:MFS transporter [Nonomuraea pusilla]SEM33470.1 Predicted arabinose efflux permease, MFS family [Nonomuraea pusilla]